MAGQNGEWRRAGVDALLVCCLVLAIFYYWFAQADRYAIFLYGHNGATPFDNATSSRYWMAGLVAGGMILTGYTTANWFLGRLAALRFHTYAPPRWWRVWLLCAPPLTAGLLSIAMCCNRPTLPLTNALLSVGATLVALAFALLPGKLAAQDPAQLVWLTAYGVGLTPSLLLLRVVELPGRSSVDTRLAYLVAVGSLLATALCVGVIALVQRLRRQPPFRLSELLAAGIGVSYLLLPLAHYCFLTPPEFRYISVAANFFAFDLRIQLLTWGVSALIARGGILLLHQLLLHQRGE
ncbi:MAG TPA: hypothetical protein PKE45_22210 [Caldilineaceae bacterium]|nr:hypothetical protein [Caldilineaceae bacterium]